MYKVIPKATDYEISTKDGTIRRIEFNSLREAELETKVNRKAIRRALNGVQVSSTWNFVKV
jgi:hypothetical protein